MGVVGEISRAMMQHLPSCPQKVVDVVKREAESLTPLTSGSIDSLDSGRDSGIFWEVLSNQTPESLAINATVLEETNPTKMLVYKASLRQGIYCETLTVSGSNEVVQKCSVGPFEARLLSQVCKDSYLPTLAKVVGGVVLGFALFKAVQNYRAGNNYYAMGWLAAGVTAAFYTDLV